MYRPLVALLLVFPVSVAASEISVQEALLRAKPAVALVLSEVASEVLLSCGPAGTMTVKASAFRETGTGWFVNPNGWLVTNAHVVAPAHKPSKGLAGEQARKAAREACVPALLARRGLQPGQDPRVESEITRQVLATVAPAARVTLDPSISVILANGIRLPAKIVKYSPPVGGAMSGRDLALLRLEAADMPSLSLADSAGAKIGDRLHILGFPGVVLSHELLNASAKMEASVTSGAISGFKEDVANQPVIQTDAPAAWGNSGGPAVTAEGQVIGVLTFVSLEAGEQGGIVQGFNFVIPSAAVRSFLADTGVVLDEPSRFNAAWYAGLRDFFAGHHARAARHLAEANRLLPELPDVRRVAAENEERLKSPRPFPWAAVGAALVLASLSGYAVLLASRWRRNRFRIRPSEVARLVETAADPPVILDVRDAKTYASSPVRIPNAIHVTQEELAGGTTTLPIDPARTVVAYCT
jgi:S1-C subfamily serine protease